MGERICLVNRYFTNGPKDAEAAYRALDKHFGGKDEGRVVIGKDSEGKDIIAEKKEDWLGDPTITVYRNAWRESKPKEMLALFRFEHVDNIFSKEHYKAEQIKNDGSKEWDPLYVRPLMSGRNDFVFGFAVYTEIFKLQYKNGELYACFTYEYESHPIETKYESHPIKTKYESHPPKIKYESNPLKTEYELKKPDEKEEPKKK